MHRAPRAPGHLQCPGEAVHFGARVRGYGLETLDPLLSKAVDAELRAMLEADIRARS